ncbi:DnaJ domain-containing protein [Kitasatospora sp. NPDC018058]|uniref:DnaJ domain-containing protein n=1 Tax=Kitasatospora sp. NPDC018058 TaxID=3364025 RepID=UPI0037BE3414
MSIPRDDPYRVLGLPHGATRDRIASAYRALARALYPDTNPDQPPPSNSPASSTPTPA